MSNPADLSFDATIRVRDTCLCLHVQRAARALRALRALAAEVRDSRITPEFIAPRALRRPPPGEAARGQRAQWTETPAVPAGWCGTREKATLMIPTIIATSK